jgi:hypothetical protein
LKTTKNNSNNTAADWCRELQAKLVRLDNAGVTLWSKSEDEAIAGLPSRVIIIKNNNNQLVH